MQVSTRTGVIIIVVVLVAIGAWSGSGRWRRMTTSKEGVVVDDVGFAWTTGTERCGTTTISMWCDELKATIGTHSPPGMETKLGVRERLYDKDEQNGRDWARECRELFEKFGAERAYNDRACARYKMRFANMCVYTKPAWVPKDQATSVKDVHGRDAGSIAPKDDVVVAAGECGTPACMSCERTMEPQKQAVLFVRRAKDDGQRWRCPVDDAAWSSAQAGGAAKLSLERCERLSP